MLHPEAALGSEVHAELRQVIHPVADGDWPQFLGQVLVQRPGGRIERGVGTMK